MTIRPAGGNVVIGILVILVLVTIGIGGYFWWQSAGRFCGGPFNIGCSKGQTCQPNDSKNPGAGGICSPTSAQNTNNASVEPVTSQNTELANWKTYTNNSLLVSLNYPPDWDYNLFNDSMAAFGPRELISGNKERLENRNTGALIGGKAWPILIENREDNKYYYSGSEISLVSDRDKNIIEENTDAGETPGKKYLITLNFEAPYIQPGDVIEVILYTRGGKKTYLTLSDQKYRQIFDQILSTFKFLDQNSDQTANWETYTNRQYDYSVSYPSSLTIKEQAGGPDDHFLFRTEFNPPAFDRSYTGVAIEVMKGNNIDSEVEYRKQRIVGHVADRIKKEAKITVGGRQGVTLEYDISAPDSRTQSQSAPLSSAIFSNGIYIYVVESDPVFLKRMLSTFKFLGTESNNLPNSSSSIIESLPLWASDIQWQDPEPTTGAVDGKPASSISRTGTGISPTSLVPAVHPKIHEELIRRDWQDNYPAEAPGTSLYHYSRIEQEKQRVIYLKYKTQAAIISGPSEPIRFATCPCPYQLEVFLSDPY